jgi:DNA processing protein
LADGTDRTGAELDSWLRLIRAPGVGAHTLREWLERSGGIEAAERDMRRGAAIPQAARDWLSNPDPAVIATDRAWLDAPCHHLITWFDDDYPALLREMPRPPVALFVRGDPGALWQPQIAIVGSRNPSAGGRDNADAFAAALAREGLVVTSGLASGVDASAHHGALRSGRQTVAVVGAGPDVAYPPVNAQLAERIAATGAIVSEFPPGTAPRPQHFPQRNRIIAGLGLGTLVIEAALRSGSLITARLAGEAGREVFALPGSIHNPMARGCHRLIRDGAKLIETAAEIVEELRPLALKLGERLRATLGRQADPDTTADARRQAQGIGDGPQRLADPDYRKLWDALDHDPVPVDLLAARSGLTAPAISSMLMLMELDGLITVGANGRYGRAGRKSE